MKKEDVDKNFLIRCDYIPPCVDGDLINLYYWDAYFPHLGLCEDGFENYAYNNIKNLIFCLDKFGCVPNMCRENGATYASQPPLLFMTIQDYYRYSGDLEFLAEVLSSVWANRALRRFKVDIFNCRTYSA